MNSRHLQINLLKFALPVSLLSILQLAELRQRLDHAEADRQELQDELRQEREAREKLEMMIKELKLQILKSSKNGKGK